MTTFFSAAQSPASRFGGAFKPQPKLSETPFADAQHKFMKGKNFWTSGDWFWERGTEKKTNQGLEFLTQAIRQSFERVFEMLGQIIQRYLAPIFQMLNTIVQQNNRILRLLQSNIPPPYPSGGNIAPFSASLAYEKIPKSFPAPPYSSSPYSQIAKNEPAAQTLLSQSKEPLLQTNAPPPGTGTK